MQIVLEFMDKGMKGLLTGDLSTFSIKTILSSIEKFMPRMEATYKEIEKVLEFIDKENNDADVSSFLQRNFAISNDAKRHVPQYDMPKEMDQSLFSTLPAREQKSLLSVTSEVSFFERTLSGQQGRTFRDLNNLEKIIECSPAQYHDQIDKKLSQLKEQTNSLINGLYDEVSEKLFALDKFIIPVHGIAQPELENPMNLFKRQLQIEELSF